MISEFLGQLGGSLVATAFGEERGRVIERCRRSREALVDRWVELELHPGAWRAGWAAKRGLCFGHGCNGAGYLWMPDLPRIGTLCYRWEPVRLPRHLIVACVLEAGVGIHGKVR